jgi:hypothetical protein
MLHSTYLGGGAIYILGNESVYIFGRWCDVGDSNNFWIYVYYYWDTRLFMPGLATGYIIVFVLLTTYHAQPPKTESIVNLNIKLSLDAPPPGIVLPASILHLLANSISLERERSTCLEGGEVVIESTYLQKYLVESAVQYKKDVAVSN